MSSCFLLTMKEDSITGIYDTLKQCAVISKAAGGIGLSVHNIRAFGSYIKVRTHTHRPPCTTHAADATRPGLALTAAASSV